MIDMRIPRIFCCSMVPLVAPRQNRLLRAAKSVAGDRSGVLKSVWTSRPPPRRESAMDDDMAIDEHDLTFLFRAVELAREALDAGDEPFGSLLVDHNGRVLREDRNRVGGGDETMHPEFELARWAARNLTADDRATADRLHVGGALPDVLGGSRVGRAGAYRLRRLRGTDQRMACRTRTPGRPGREPPDLGRRTRHSDRRTRAATRGSAPRPLRAAGDPRSAADSASRPRQHRPLAPRPPPRPRSVAKRLATNRLRPRSSFWRTNKPDFASRT